MVEKGPPDFPAAFPMPGSSGADETVSFLCEDVDFDLPEQEALMAWIQQVIDNESCRLHTVSFIFCSDAYLHQLNMEYLDHDTLTDVITFPYLDPPQVEGDIFISIDRIRENAKDYAVSFEQELRRVMIHGVLHLCGYSDKTPEEKAQMTQKEDQALALLHGDQR